MAKDPAFLFYPGDYLRDTQCLSEKSQVAYDRIMCEHMRNICISESQVNFFTKRLTPEEKEELTSLLTKVPGGFQIEWVAISISKRKAYSKSRADNRTKKGENICKSYDHHMENENENVIIQKGVVGENTNSLCPRMMQTVKLYFPFYPVDEERDYSACLQIAYKIAKQKKWEKESVLNGKMEETISAWEKIVLFIAEDKWFSERSVSDFNKEFQRIVQSMANRKKKYNKSDDPPSGPSLQIMN